MRKNVKCLRDKTVPIFLSYIVLLSLTVLYSPCVDSISRKVALIQILAFLNPDEIPEDMLHYNQTGLESKKKAIDHHQIKMWIFLAIALLAVFLNILDIVLVSISPSYHLVSASRLSIPLTLLAICLAYALFSDKSQQSRVVAAVWIYLELLVGMKKNRVCSALYK